MIDKFINKKLISLDNSMILVNYVVNNFETNFNDFLKLKYENKTHIFFIWIISHQKDQNYRGLASMINSPASQTIELSIQFVHMWQLFIMPAYYGNNNY